MKFNEAIQAIGTASADVEGVPKRVGKKIVRRPVPAGYVADVRKAKKKKRKKKDDEDEEELEEMLKQLPRAIASLNMSKFWDKGVQYADEEPEDDDEDDDDDDDPEEMASATRPVQPDYVNQMTDKFWDWNREGKSWYAGRTNDEEPEDDEDEEDAKEGRQITRDFGSGHAQSSMNPFWRKSHTPMSYYPDDDDEDEEDESEPDTNY